MDAQRELRRQRPLTVELGRNRGGYRPRLTQRNRGTFGYGSCVVGTVAVGAGAVVLAQGGDPGLGIGLILGGLGLGVVGYL